MREVPLAWHGETQEPFDVPDEARFWKIRKLRNARPGAGKPGPSSFILDGETSRPLLLPIDATGEDLASKVDSGFRYTLIPCDAKGRRIGDITAQVLVGELDESEGDGGGGAGDRITRLERTCDRLEGLLTTSHGMVERLAAKAIEGQATLVGAVAALCNPALSLEVAREQRRPTLTAEQAVAIAKSEEEPPPEKSSVDKLIEAAIPVLQLAMPALVQKGIEMLSKAPAAAATEAATAAAQAAA